MPEAGGNELGPVEPKVASFALEPRRDDLVLRHPSTGALYIYRMSGTTQQALHQVTPAPGPAWAVTAAGDFNKDGVSDLTWVYNTSVGETRLWLMNGSVSIAGIDQEPVGGPDAWIIGGTGDFDGNGSTDIFWYQRKTGDISTWFMTGTSTTPANRVQRTGPGLGWEVAGVGDLNNDGYADVIWRDRSNGSVVIWYMQGVNRLSTSTLASVPDLAWIPVGTGEFNGDQQTDLLWFNKSTRQFLVWKLVNGQASGTISFSLGNMPADTLPVAVGEFPIKLEIVNVTPTAASADYTNCATLRTGGASYSLGCNRNTPRSYMVEVPIMAWPYCNGLGFDFDSNLGTDRTTANVNDKPKMVFTRLAGGVLKVQFEDAADNDFNDLVFEIKRFNNLNYGVENSSTVTCNPL
jgi:hypothetical protein